MLFLIQKCYCFLQLRVDPVGPAFDLALPLEVVIGTVPHRTRRADAVPGGQSPAHASGGPSPSPSNQRLQEAGSRNGRADAAVHRVGVPVLPTQSGHMVTPSHLRPSSPPGSDNGRPPSRVSNAPSTSSSSSAPSKRCKISIVLSASFGDKYSHKNTSLIFACVSMIY